MLLPILLLACTDGPDCGQATLDLAEPAADPAAFDGDSAIVCGEYRILEEVTPDCEPVGGDDPQLQDDYLTWRAATWGIAQDNVTLGIVAVQGGITVLTARPDLVEGEQLIVGGVLHYDTVADPCDLDLLYPSAWLELDAAWLGLDIHDPGDPPDDARTAP